MGKFGDGVEIRRGEVLYHRLPVGQFADGSTVTVPVMTIGGAADGPTLYVQAGIHGDELTGITVCQEFLRSIDPGSLSGSLIAVPVANVPAYLTRTRGFLHEERWLIDMNRNWPGTSSGLLTERIADLLFQRFIRNADFSIDLHSALDGCDIVPFTYVDPDDDNHGTLGVRERRANVFGTRYVFYHSATAKFGTSNMTQSLNTQADLHGAPAMSAEMGESRRVSWDVVPIGVRGITNVMKTMEMLKGALENDGAPRAFSRFVNVHAERGGGLRVAVDLHDEVVAGQYLGEIVDPFGDRVASIEAPVDGFILRIMRLGSVSSGAEVAWIGV